MCADDGSRSTFDIPPAHPDRDPLRVIKRADSALHDPGQLNLGEFKAVADGGEQVGPIIFANTAARLQLKIEGYVITFRKSERTTGETWWRESRTGPKQGDVQVTHMREVDPRDYGALANAWKFSGFGSVSAWQEAIRELNGGLPESGHLYEVTVR